jgi:nicotinamide-nucleotide amidase
MSLKIEILSTGDEVLNGAIVDANAAYIATAFEEKGIPVLRHNCVGDDMDALVAIFKEIGSRADIALVTGGLGPTQDDLSAEAAGKAAGISLALDEKALCVVERFFKARNVTMKDANRKQAMLPENAEMLDNPVGTAPGFSMKIDECTFFFMPGVPHEMKKMLAEQVLPRVDVIYGLDTEVQWMRKISIFGLPESNAAEALTEFKEKFPQLRLGFQVKFPEILIKVYGQGKDKDEIARQVEDAIEWVCRQVENNVVSKDGATMAEVIGKLLLEKNGTIAIAESCTGGLISHLLTNVAGSSDYFIFSGVTYSNDAKTNILGVPAALIQEYGAVHEETVKAMAEGARRISGATFGLATSGIAGPGGGTEDKPVGTLCIGLASGGETTAVRRVFSYGKRHMIKQFFAMAALDMLRRYLLK